MLVTVVWVAQNGTRRTATSVTVDFLPEFLRILVGLRADILEVR